MMLYGVGALSLADARSLAHWCIVFVTRYS